MSAVDRAALPIATLDLESGGRIGVCPLPGRDGDLDADLETVRRWGPAIVVSMTERDEMQVCGAGRLDEALAGLGAAWAHLPIRDYGGPEGASNEAWPALSARLHACLDRGDGVLLHCRGGRGRSGMIALRLLVERGAAPEAALARLRRERPGAVETDGQFAWASMGARRSVTSRRRRRRALEQDALQVDHVAVGDQSGCGSGRWRGFAGLAD